MWVQDGSRGAPTWGSHLHLRKVLWTSRALHRTWHDTLLSLHPGGPYSHPRVSCVWAVSGDVGSAFRVQDTAK